MVMTLCNIPYPWFWCASELIGVFCLVMNMPMDWYMLIAFPFIGWLMVRSVSHLLASYMPFVFLVFVQETETLAQNSWKTVKTSIYFRRFVWHTFSICCKNTTSLSWRSFCLSRRDYTSPCSLQKLLQSGFVSISWLSCTHSFHIFYLSPNTHMVVS